MGQENHGIECDVYAIADEDVSLLLANLGVGEVPDLKQCSLEAEAHTVARRFALGLDWSSGMEAHDLPLDVADGVVDACVNLMTERLVQRWAVERAERDEE